MARPRGVGFLRAFSVLLLGVAALLGTLYYADGYFEFFEYFRVNVPYFVTRAWLPIAYLAFLIVTVLLVILGRFLLRTRWLKDRPVIGTVWIVIGATFVYLALGLLALSLARHGVS